MSIVLFTADIHIKLGQKNVPVDWARNRYKLMIEEFKKCQEDADIFIIGGDVFDKLPNMEELEIYFDLVASCTVPTYIIDGNHEATKKGQTFFSRLKSVTNSLNKFVTIVDEMSTIEGIDYIPYCKLKDFEKHGNTSFSSRILVTHARAEIPPHVKPEVDLSIFDKWKVVLAGDLHSYENCQRNILYPGSPVTTSFHRSETDTGVIMLNTDTLYHEWRKLKLPQLLRKTIKAGDPMEPTNYHHTIYEVEGDMAELGAMQDSELLSKKVVKREIDTALILDPKMSLAEELKEYLMYILQLDEGKADKLVHTLNNNIHKIV